MTRPIIVQPAAHRDIDALADYIGRTSSRTAIRFYDAVSISYARLAAQPDLGTKCDVEFPGLTNLRVWPIRGFPNHLIFYRVADDSITVVRILHGARDAAGAFDDS